MAARFNVDIFGMIVFPFFGLVVVSSVIFLVYYITVMLPEREAYCAASGREYISMDRSWACKDPKTGQLFR